MDNKPKIIIGSFIGAIIILIVCFLIGNITFNTQMGTSDLTPKFLDGVVSASSENQNDTREIGYEFLDDNKVVHIWNTQDDYYFNKSSGIQLTNHYEDYWTRNIFCVGFYTPSGNWTERACADSFDSVDFTIETDNETYVRLSFAKDFEQEPTPLRLGANYYLGLNDKNLTINISTKNIGTHPFPQELGFAWKIKDVNIPDSDGKTQPYGDSIEINNTRYKLNDTFDLIFKNMSYTYYDDELEEFVTEYDSNFRMQDWTKFLKVDWNENLNYAVKMYGNGNQEDFYVALLINAGHFNPNQEKSTTFQWIDAEGDYTNVHWDISTYSLDSEGLTTDGTNIWISDRYDVAIYKYDMDGNYVSTIDNSGDYSYIYGITTDDTYFWLIDRYTDVVYKYWFNWTYITSYDISDPVVGAGEGITTDGTNIWVVDGINGVVYKFNMEMVYQESSFDASTYCENDCYDITTDGNYIWLPNYIADAVYKYSMDGVYISSFSVSTQSGDAYGITNDGTYFWVVDKGDEEVYQYELAPPPDETLPTYSNNQTNTTIAGASCNFSITYDDDTALEPDGEWIFSTNNTGTWTNESVESFTDTPEWANVTKTLNSTSGISIGFRWYANDTAGNNNNTGIFSLITTSADTCTCPGAGNNWEIDLIDNCNIADNCDLVNGNITFINTGTITFNATITTCQIGDLPADQKGYLGSLGAIKQGGSC